MGIDVRERHQQLKAIWGNTATDMTDQGCTLSERPGDSI